MRLLSIDAVAKMAAFVRKRNLSHADAYNSYMDIAALTSEFQYRDNSIEHVLTFVQSDEMPERFY